MIYLRALRVQRAIKNHWDAAAVDISYKAKYKKTSGAPNGTPLMQSMLLYYLPYLART